MMKNKNKIKFYFIKVAKDQKKNANFCEIAHRKDDHLHR